MIHCFYLLTVNKEYSYGIGNRKKIFEELCFLQSKPLHSSVINGNASCNSAVRALQLEFAGKAQIVPVLEEQEQKVLHGWSADGVGERALLGPTALSCTERTSEQGTDHSSTPCFYQNWQNDGSVLLLETVWTQRTVLESSTSSNERYHDPAVSRHL